MQAGMRPADRRGARRPARHRAWTAGAPVEARIRAAVLDSTLEASGGAAEGARPVGAGGGTETCAKAGVVDAGGTAAGEGGARHAEPPAGQRVLRTLMTLTTALVLAFTFRAFIMEPFIIPTGSMAPGLRGDHVTRMCRNCGWEFDVGPARDAAAIDGPRMSSRVVCPNCQYAYEAPGAPPPVTPGDRILVHKWPYELGGMLGPRRWDVVVFRDPGNPTQNYIKRLVGLPGEEVEIVGGDVFIDGRIARKTPAAQAALWSVVFDQAYLPQEPGSSGVWACWTTPDAPVGAPAWRFVDQRRLEFNPVDTAEHTVRFSALGPHAFGQDMSGYNGEASGASVKDVRLVAELTRREGDGWVRLTMRAAGRECAARIGPGGGATLFWPGGSRAAEFGVVRGRPMRLEFGHLDYRVFLRADGRDVIVTRESEYGPDLASERESSGSGELEVEIGAANGVFSIRNPRIERDVYYTYRPGVTRRAYAGHGFRLAADEFFVLGDNSSQSHDSREWYESGPHLGSGYRAGTVTREQIVGQAFMVYLPGLLPADDGYPWRFPDVGRMRVVR